jgi:hypothetical protein
MFYLDLKIQVSAVKIIFRLIINIAMVCVNCLNIWGQKISSGAVAQNYNVSGKNLWTQVVALNMECEDEFEDDREGQIITAAVNKHLPEEASPSPKSQTS